MKTLQITLLTLVAVAFAACAPQNPPSQYGRSSVKNTGFDDNINGSGLDRRGPGTGGADTLFDSATGKYDPRAIVATIYFGFDRYTVSSDQGAKLNAIANRGQNTNLIAAGYTDHFGTDQYNLGLSDKRAQSVKNYLSELGMNDANIEIKAFGKQYANPGGSKEEVASDRRVDIVDANFKP